MALVEYNNTSYLLTLDVGEQCLMAEYSKSKMAISFLPRIRYLLEHCFLNFFSDYEICS